MAIEILTFAEEIEEFEYDGKFAKTEVDIYTKDNETEEIKLIVDHSFVGVKEDTIDIIKVEAVLEGNSIKTLIIPVPKFTFEKTSYDEDYESKIFENVKFDQDILIHCYSNRVKEEKLIDAGTVINTVTNEINFNLDETRTKILFTDIVLELDIDGKCWYYDVVV